MFPPDGLLRIWQLCEIIEKITNLQSCTICQWKGFWMIIYFVVGTGKYSLQPIVVDLNRENIRGFDVREFYVKLAEDLKRRGY